MIAFEKQLGFFEAQMESDLKTRTSEVAKKWEFDFTIEKPCE